jgi:hypothetical protein
MTEEQRIAMFKNFKDKRLRPTKETILDTMTIQYFPSDKFIFKDTSEGFESLPRFKYMLHILEPVLESKDGDFVGVFDPETYRKKDAKKQPSVQQLNECHFIIGRMMLLLSHRYIMARRLRWISWRTLKRKMNYRPADYLDNKFNADTVITYKIRLKAGERFREKYKHCEGLMFTKTNVGCAAFYCFYTKEGYKKRDEYIREIGQMFRYK